MPSVCMPINCIRLILTIRPLFFVPRVRPRQDADARFPQRELCGAPWGAHNAVDEGPFAAFSGGDAAPAGEYMEV